MCTMRAKPKPNPSSNKQHLIKMGPIWCSGGSVEELGSTKSYWRSKRLSKRVKVPNLWLGQPNLHVYPREREGKAIHSFNICPKAPHGSKIQCCNMRRRIGVHQIILEEQTSFEEGQGAKPGSGSQTYMFTPVKGRGRPSIPSIYAPRLLMGPKYNVATGREEFTSTQAYWRSKHHSKWAKVPNLAQAAKSELFAPLERW